MTPEDFIKRVRAMEDKYEASIRSIKQPIAQVAKEHFDRSFKEEGFTDAVLERWPKRSPDSRPQDPTLYETGRLSSSNRVLILERGVSIINSTPYGAYHNYGIGQKKRQFIGNSIALNRQIVSIITNSIKRALKA
jgi:hypothetical protein